MHGANMKIVEEAVQAVKLFTQTVYLLLDFVFPFTLCEINALNFFMILFWVHDRLRIFAKPYGIIHLFLLGVMEH